MQRVRVANAGQKVELCTFFKLESVDIKPGSTIFWKGAADLAKPGMKPIILRVILADGLARSSPKSSEELGKGLTNPGDLEVEVAAADPLDKVLDACVGRKLVHTQFFCCHPTLCQSSFDKVLALAEPQAVGSSAAMPPLAEGKILPWCPHHLHRPLR